MPVKHKFVSSVPNIGGGTYIQPTHWNDQHNMPPVLAMHFVASSFAWTNMPSAYTVMVGGGSYVGWYDFTNVEQVRLNARIAGSSPFASAQLMVEFSANQGANWFPLATGATGPFVGIGSGAPASGLHTVKVGSWFSVNPSAVAAGADGAILRVRGFMGDGALDPAIQSVSLFVL